MVIVNMSHSRWTSPSRIICWKIVIIDFEAILLCWVPIWTNRSLWKLQRKREILKYRLCGPIRYTSTTIFLGASIDMQIQKTIYSLFSDVIYKIFEFIKKSLVVLSILWLSTCPSHINSYHIHSHRFNKIHIFLTKWVLSIEFTHIRNIGVALNHYISAMEKSFPFVLI